MIRIVLFAIATAALGSCYHAEQQTEDTGALADDSLKSGYAFLQPDTQALQDDDFANPGFLWVDRGHELFHETGEAQKSCADCHGTDGTELKGSAVKYPALDKASGELLNLEGRINMCRTRHQGRDELAYESEALLSLTAYVANLSRGMPLAVTRSPALEERYENGQRYYFTRRGQFNLSCNQCHDDHWGKMLRGDRLSQGHGNGFPAYRLEWQALGSLHRRMRDCDVGVRAEPYPLGSRTYVDLEYYLAVRASSLPLESPAVRR